MSLNFDPTVVFFMFIVKNLQLFTYICKQMTSMSRTHSFRVIKIVFNCLMFILEIREAAFPKKETQLFILAYCGPERRHFSLLFRLVHFDPYANEQRV